MALVWIGVNFVASVKAGAQEWTADGVPEAAAALQARNAQIGAGLAALPGLPLQPVPVGLDLGTVELVTDGSDLPREVVLGRLDRLGHWEAAGDPFAIVELWVRDGTADLALALSKADGGSRREAAAVIDRVAAVLAEQGLVACDISLKAPLPVPVGQGVIDAARIRLDRADRQTRRVALLGRAGPLAALVLTAATLAGSLLMIEGALESGRAARIAGAAAPVSFETDAALPVTRLWGLLPRYALAGHVGAQALVLPVPREAYIRAAPGARYTVVAAGDAAVPFMLLSRAEGTGPVLPAGAGAGVPVLALVFLGALLSGWWLGVGRPVMAYFRGKPGALVQVSRFGLLLLKVAAGCVLIVVVRVLVG